MYNQDDGFREDPLGVSRGILIGLILGSLIWAGMIGFVVYVMWK